MPDHQPSEPRPLDDDHVLEPVDPQRADSSEPAEPIVRDVAGRLWKVRRRRTAWQSVPVALAVLLLLAALTWLIAGL